MTQPDLPHKQIIKAKKGVASLSNAFLAQSVTVDTAVEFSCSSAGLSTTLENNIRIRFYICCKLFIDNYTLGKNIVIIPLNFNTMELDKFYHH